MNTEQGPELHEHMEREFMLMLADISHANLENMEGLSEEEAFIYVKNAIDSNVIAFGVFPDTSSPDGLGMKVIKGLRDFQVIISSGKSEVMSITAIPCECLEQAEFAAKLLGDGLLVTQ
jgi:hypothetical protein